MGLREYLEVWLQTLHRDGAIGGIRYDEIVAPQQFYGSYFHVCPFKQACRVSSCDFVVCFNVFVGFGVIVTIWGILGVYVLFSRLPTSIF